MRKMTATLSFSKPRVAEISLTYHYQILWTGEDYEVTISSEPDETGGMEFIQRGTRESLAACISFVKYVLRRDIVEASKDMVVFEEEI